jgi:transposase-like protein
MGVLIASAAGGRMSIMTPRRRKSPEQIVRLLGQADQLLANGEDLASVCRTLGISESSFHRWRERYGGMNVDDAKRLKELETENATLKRLLADAEVEKAALKKIAKGKF